MANQQNSYTGSQGTGTNNADFAFTFPSFTTSEVKVEVDNVVKTLTTHYTVENYNTTSGGTVRFTAGNIPTGTTPVRIFRQTNVDNPKATFTAGSSLKAGEINDNFKQVRHALQEAIGAVATDRKVQRFNIEADSIDGTLIADDVIDSEHYVAGSIDLEHMSANSVDSDQYVDGSIDLIHMSANSVDSDQYVDGSIDRVHLEADIIDSTKLADNSVNSEHYVDGSIDHEHLANDVIDGDNIQDDVINSEHIAAGALDNEHYAAGSITSDKLNGATVVTNSEQSGYSVNDTSFFTTSASDARYFNISSGETIKDGDTFPDNDTTIATTAAINDRIIDLVDDVGGFVPIANETSFPTANPDVNNGTGTLVSIKEISSTRTPSTGTVTIANGSGSNTVTITGCGSTVLTAGFGVIVETTAVTHTYAFHRLVPKATEVTTVAGVSGNITTVAGIASNVTTVAGIASNVTTVAGAATNVNNVGGSIASVNTAAANLNSIANYGDQYQVASSNPSTDGGGNSLAAGDLYFNTTANELKVYNGSQWQGGVTASGDFATVTGNTYTGDNVYQDNAKLKLGTSSDLEIFHNANDSIINDAGTGDLKIQSGGSTKLQITSSGVDVTGNITVSGTVDGIDIATDVAANTAKVTNATHTGEVTGATALTIADNVVDEANLKVSNSPTNGYFLSAQSGNTGGLTWAAVASDLVDDTSPQLGGGLDLNSNDITGTGNINVTGNLTLTGADPVIHLVDSNNNSDFSIYGNGGVFTISDATNTADRFEIFSNGSTNINGILNVSSTVNCNGGLDTDGDVQLNSGTTNKNILFDASDMALEFNDDVKATFGDGDDLKIYHDGTDNIFESTVDTDLFVFKNTAGSSELRIQGHEGNAAAISIYADEGDDPGDKWKFTANTDGVAELSYLKGSTGNFTKAAQFTNDAGTSLWHTGVKKFETSSTGITVTGTVAATAYTGDGSGLTGLQAGATGGNSGANAVFWENENTVTHDYTISNNKNAGSFGPITINNGVTVTVGSGEIWTIV